MRGAALAIALELPAVFPSALDAVIPALAVELESEDVARRFAAVGFLALAPDGLFPVGGYPGNDEEGKMLQDKLNPAQLQTDMLNSANFLKNHALSSGKFGFGSLPDFKAPTAEEARATPGYQFTQQQGEQGILRGAASSRSSRKCSASASRSAASSAVV
mgnify:CR=1 FL=1